MLVHSTLLPLAQKAAQEAGIDSSQIILTDEQDVNGFPSFKTLLTGQELTPVRILPEEVKERIAFMCYSSGTTGRPKGVESSVYNLTCTAKQYV